jgi:hypothetical protein
MWTGAEQRSGAVRSTGRSFPPRTALMLRIPSNGPTCFHRCYRANSNSRRQSAGRRHSRRAAIPVGGTAACTMVTGALARDANPRPTQNLGSEAITARPQRVSLASFKKAASSRYQIASRLWLGWTAAERSRRANLSEGDALILTDEVRDVRIRAPWHNVFPTCVKTVGGLHACSPPGSC